MGTCGQRAGERGSTAGGRGRPRHRQAGERSGIHDGREVGERGRGNMVKQVFSAPCFIWNHMNRSCSIWANRVTKLLFGSTPSILVRNGAAGVLPNVPLAFTSKLLDPPAWCREIVEPMCRVQGDSFYHGETPHGRQCHGVFFLSNQ